MKQEGRCLCGEVAFEVAAEPDWVTICYCRFCQKATGSSHMIEPIFQRDAFRVTAGTPQVYTHISGGSGKEVYVHFCGRCASKLYLTFERWDDRLGVYSGAFDDPSWFEIEPENTKFIFLAEAPRGTIVPPRYRVFDEHAATPEGEPLEPRIFAEAHHVGRA